MGELPLPPCGAGAAMALPGNQLLSLTADPMVKRFVVGVLAVLPATAFAQDAGPFPPPKTRPPIISPGKTSADPPSDAIVLFDGKSLSHWRSSDGTPAKWQVRDGYVEVAAGTGDIMTTEAYGD